MISGASGGQTRWEHLLWIRTKNQQLGWISFDVYIYHSEAWLHGKTYDLLDEGPLDAEGMPV